MLSAPVYAQKGATTNRVVVEGIADLRWHDFEREPFVPLRGTFSFYWQKFYAAADFAAGQAQEPPLPYQVPGLWNALTSEYPAVSTFGYATVRVVLLLPEEIRGQRMALALPTTSSAYRLYANGNLLYEVGKVGTSPDEVSPAYERALVDIRPSSDTLELIWHVSNFHHRKSGLWDPFIFGKEDVLERENEWNKLAEMFLAGALLIMALYHLGIYYLRRGDRSPLFFAAACLLFFLRTFATGMHQVKDYWPDISWELHLRLDYFSLMLIVSAFILFVDSVFSPKLLKISRVIAVFGVLGAMLTLLLPVFYVTHLLNMFNGLLAISFPVGTYIMYRAWLARQKELIPFSIGFAILFFTVVHDVLEANEVIEGEPIFAVGMITMILAQSFVLSLRFSRSFVRAEKLGNELLSLNQSLEKKVIERTTQLESANGELLAINEEISRQADILQEANNEIAAKNRNITASINYAKRIQEALLVEWDEVRKHIPASFVLFRPRDIVSGDFYWFTHREGISIIAMLDCTGHGVPGAFMSIIGNELLNTLTNQTPPTQWDAATMLQEMDEGVRTVLKQSETNRTDGMDMGLCLIDHSKKTLRFAGAKVPLAYIGEQTQGRMQVIKGTNRSVGGQVFSKLDDFVQHELRWDTPLTFYLYSDGFQDQFGGSEGRKFMAKPFRNLLEQSSHQAPEVQKTYLEEALENWKGKRTQLDDVLVMRFSL